MIPARLIPGMLFKWDNREGPQSLFGGWGINAVLLVPIFLPHARNWFERLKPNMERNVDKGDGDCTDG